MSTFEKEVKILNIDINITKEKLKNIGAEFIDKKIQKIYTYDIPTIYHRYLEVISLLGINNELLRKTTLTKLHIILDEFVDLINEKDMKKIYTEMKITNFEELFYLETNEIIERFNNSKTFQKEISSQLINPNKWLRLRQSNEKIELTLKHIYEKNDLSLQKVKECEILVSNLEETNQLLEEIGIVRRNYQEKIRHSFKYKTAEIELDEWLGLEPYMEIECEDTKVIEEIIEQLDFNSKEIVSLNTAQLYKRKNIDILKISDLKF